MALSVDGPSLSRAEALSGPQPLARGRATNTVSDRGHTTPTRINMKFGQRDPNADRSAVFNNVEKRSYLCSHIYIYERSLDPVIVVVSLEVTWFEVKKHSVYFLSCLLSYFLS